jgi:hypothetical protein
MPRDNGTVRIHTFSREMVARMVRIVAAQTTGRTVLVAGSKELPRITRKHNYPVDEREVIVPDELPFKYIVLGSSVNPGAGVRYETDTLLTSSDVDRMINSENLKVIFDKGPWTW